MTVDLTGKTNAELRNLRENAERLLALKTTPAKTRAAAEALLAELAARPVPATRTPAAGRSPKSIVAAEVSARLAAAAKGFEATYDLTRETAAQDTRIPHALVGKDGKAKVGGAEKTGTLLLDRYISHRRRDMVATLSFEVRAGGDVEADGAWVARLYPVGDADPPASYTGQDFDAAVQAFRAHLDSIATKREG